MSESSIIRPLKVTKIVPKFNTGRGFARCFTTFQECDLRHTEAFKVSEESTVSCLTDEINRVIFYTSQWFYDPHLFLFTKYHLFLIERSGNSVNEDMLRHLLMCPSITSKSVGPHRSRSVPANRARFYYILFTALNFLHQCPVAARLFLTCLRVEIHTSCSPPWRFPHVLPRVHELQPTC